jgi:hypothetical protein
MTVQPFIKRDDVIAVGQSGGGWGAIALASQNPKTVRAIIGFEAQSRPIDTARRNSESGADPLLAYIGIKRAPAAQASQETQDHRMNRIVPPFMAFLCFLIAFVTKLFVG